MLVFASNKHLKEKRCSLLAARYPELHFVHHQDRLFLKKEKVLCNRVFESQSNRLYGTIGSIFDEVEVHLLSSNIHIHPRTLSFITSSQASCLLSSERAAFCESGLATGGLAEDCRAAGADDDGLCVRENGGDCEATGALDVHEERSGSWDQGLELVLAGLGLRGRVEEIDCENHFG